MGIIQDLVAPLRKAEQDKQRTAEEQRQAYLAEAVNEADGRPVNRAIVEAGLATFGSLTEAENAWSRAQKEHLRAKEVERLHAEQDEVQKAIKECRARSREIRSKTELQSVKDARGNGRFIYSDQLKRERETSEKVKASGGRVSWEDYRAMVESQHALALLRAEGEWLFRYRLRSLETDSDRISERIKQLGN